jgi:DNA-binding Xre family transcriptional regulator
MPGREQEDGHPVELAQADGRPRHVPDHRPGAGTRRPGIHLSREQVFRLVTQVPQRLSTDALAALCDILECTPNDLIEVEVVNAEVRKTAGEPGGQAPAVRRTSIRRPEGL